MTPRSSFLAVRWLGWLATIGLSWIIAGGLTLSPAWAQEAAIAPSPEALVLEAEQPEPPPPPPLRIDGSGMMAFLNQALRQAYQALRPDQPVEIASRGTEEALAALQSGELDLAALGRSLTPTERANGLKEHALQIEDIAIVVGRTNSFHDALTLEQLTSIFHGDISNWQQVGGADLPIRVVEPLASSDLRSPLLQQGIVLPAEQWQAQATANRRWVQVTSEAAIPWQLGRDGIGYAVAGTLPQTARSLPLKVVQNTVPADVAYPYGLTRAFAYRGSTLSGNTRAFLGFVSAAGGQQAIATGRATEADGGDLTLPESVAEPAPPPAPVVLPEPNPTLESLEPEPDANLLPQTDSSVADEEDAETVTQLPPVESAEVSESDRIKLLGWLWALLLPLVLILFRLLRKRLAKSVEADEASLDGDSPISDTPEVGAGTQEPFPPTLNGAGEATDPWAENGIAHTIESSGAIATESLSPLPSATEAGNVDFWQHTETPPVTSPLPAPEGAAITDEAPSTTIGEEEAIAPNNEAPDIATGEGDAEAEELTESDSSISAALRIESPTITIPVDLAESADAATVAELTESPDLAESADSSIVTEPTELEGTEAEELGEEGITPEQQTPAVEDDFDEEVPTADAQEATVEEALVETSLNNGTVITEEQDELAENDLREEIGLADEQDTPVEQDTLGDVALDEEIVTPDEPDAFIEDARGEAVVSADEQDLSTEEEFGEEIATTDEQDALVEEPPEQPTDDVADAIFGDKSVEDESLAIDEGHREAEQQAIARVTELEEAIAQFHQDLQAVQQEKLGIEATVVELMQQLDQQYALAEQSDHDRAALEQQLASVQEQLTTTATTKAEVEAALIKTQQEFQGSETGALHAALDYAEAEQFRLVSEVSLLRSRLDHSQQSLTALEIERETLQEQLAIAQQVQHDTAEFTHQLTTLETEKATIEAERTQLNEQLTTTQEALREAEAQQGDLHQRLTILEAENEAIERERRQLEGQLTEQLASLQATLETLTQQIAIFDAEKIASAAERAHLQEQLTTTLTRLEVAEIQQAERIQQFATLEVEKAAIEAEYRQLQAQFDQTQTALREAETQQAMLNQRLTNLDAER